MIIKATLLGIVGLIVGMFVISHMILPFAADLLARPDIAAWTGLGAGLRLLGLALLGSLVVAYLRATWKAAKGE